MSDFPKSWLTFCGEKMVQEVSVAEANVAAIEAQEIIYPAKENRYRALQMKPEQVSVVILGQDPYHGEKLCHGQLLPQAMGLSFSVPEGMRFPPSLRNIDKELAYDVGVHLPSGDLSHWAEQGVLLLNTSLTVTKGAAGSHKNFGWQKVTDHIIRALGQSELPRVFILWGAHARTKVELIDKRHKVIESVHPSPMSANRGDFFKSKPFSRTNAFLQQHGRPAINW